MSRRKQRWSIQVDRYPAKGERMYGPRTVVTSVPVPPDTPWSSSDTTVVPNTEVDEIFIDGWLHLEAMGARDYWMDVAGIDISVRLGKDGRPKKVIYRIEPIPGVEYVDDTHARPE